METENRDYAYMGQRYFENACNFRDRNMYLEAVRELEKALECGYDEGRVRIDMGVNYFKQRMFDRAEEELNKALILKPGCGEIYAVLGTVHNITGAYEDAVRELREAAGKGYDTVEINRELGLAYKNKGEYVPAEKEFRKAVKRGMDTAEIHRELARVYHKMNNYRKALIEFGKAAELSPEDGALHLEIAGLHRELGDYKKASEEYRKAEDSGAPGCRQDGDFHILLGRIARAAGQDAEAMEEFERASGMSADRDKPWFKNWILNEMEITGKKTRLESLPRSLAVFLTNRCNLKCVMCGGWQDPEDLDERVIREVRQLFPVLQYVTWLGGEPLLAPSFRSLFEEACSFSSLRQTVFTNGLLIDRGWAKLLASSGADLVVSVDGFTKEAYESIRVGGDFDTLLENLALVNEYRRRPGGGSADLAMQMVVMEQNYRELPGIMDFVRKYGFNKLIIVPAKDSINRADAFYRGKKEGEFIRKAVEGILEQAPAAGLHAVNAVYAGYNEPAPSRADRKGKMRKKTKTEYGEASCLFPWQMMNINVAGKVTSYCFCPDYEIGDAVKSGIREAWNSAGMQALRESMIKGHFADACNSGCISGVIPKESLQLDFM
ncbi:MAG: tetratricopeptide repeat protein [Elusimicrobia bacterium]|nr:tetratricopeptide repeat protein [Elusimicrobiota bacterium]